MSTPKSAPPQPPLPLAHSHPQAPFLAHLGDLARPVARQFFRVPLAVERKADDSPVTRADRDIELLLRDAIRDAFPEDGLYGEEHGADNTQSNAVWVLDPIDGTQSFISGMPTFGTLVARLEQGRPVLGMVDMPVLQERWMGARGHRTTCNGRPCHARTGVPLAGAMVYATSPDIFRGSERDRFEQVSRRAAQRRFGGDCYAYGLLASGHIDAVIESGLEPYDYLPLVPVVEGAGGCITDWAGRPLGLHSGPQVVAAGSQELHAELLALLRP